MACPIDAKEIEKLKLFIQFCSMTPHILHRPELEFFKTFVEKLGGKVPEAPQQQKPAPEPTPTKPTESAPKPEATTPASDSDDDQEDMEPEPEIDREGCVDPDTEEPHEMGDADKEPSEDDMDKANELRGKAQGLFSERKFDEAIQVYTEAIVLNPRNALYFAKRGQCLLKSNKPNACIRDCTAALEKNPDSAAAYKFRGRAHRLLGNWEESARDLRQACKIDFDEEADEWLREVTPKAHKIEQYRVDKERRQNEREIKQRIKRNQKAREAHRRAAEEEKAAGGAGGFAGGMPGGMPGGGPSPFGKMGGMQGMFDDPEIQKVMMEILSDPTKLAKYAADPKYKPLFDMMGMMGGGAGGMPGGMPFGFPGGAGGGMEDDLAADGGDEASATEGDPPKTQAPPKASNLSDDLD